jgi:hypothetical protein
MNLISISMEKIIFDVVLSGSLVCSRFGSGRYSSVLSSWSVCRSTGDFLPTIFCGHANLLEFVSSVVFRPPPGQARVFCCKLKGRHCFLPFPSVFAELGSVPART